MFPRPVEAAREASSRPGPLLCPLPAAVGLGGTGPHSTHPLGCQLRVPRALDTAGCLGTAPLCHSRSCALPQCGERGPGPPPIPKSISRPEAAQTAAAPLPRVPCYSHSMSHSPGASLPSAGHAGSCNTHCHPATEGGSPPCLHHPCGTGSAALRQPARRPPGWKRCSAVPAAPGAVRLRGGGALRVNGERVGPGSCEASNIWKAPDGRVPVPKARPAQPRSPGAGAGGLPAAAKGHPVGMRGTRTMGPLLGWVDGGSRGPPSTHPPTITATPHRVGERRRWALGCTGGAGSSTMAPLRCRWHGG